LLQVLQFTALLILLQLLQKLLLSLTNSEKKLYISKNPALSPGFFWYH
jgi:hypothetical protein